MFSSYLMCAMAQMKEQVLYAFSICLLLVRTIKSYWNKRKYFIVSPKFLSWVGKGKRLTNVWFVHCLKATKMSQHSSLSSAHSNSLFNGGIHAKIPKYEVSMWRESAYQRWELTTDFIHLLMALDVLFNLSESKSFHLKNRIVETMHILTLSQISLFCL